MACLLSSSNQQVGSSLEGSQLTMSTGGAYSGPFLTCGQALFAKVYTDSAIIRRRLKTSVRKAVRTSAAGTNSGSLGSDPPRREPESPESGGGTWFRDQLGEPQFSKEAEDVDRGTGSWLSGSWEEVSKPEEPSGGNSWPSTISDLPVSDARSDSMPAVQDEPGRSQQGSHWVSTGTSDRGDNASSWSESWEAVSMDNTKEVPKQQQLPVAKEPKQNTVDKSTVQGRHTDSLKSKEKQAKTAFNKQRYLRDPPVKVLKPERPPMSPRGSGWRRRPPPGSGGGFGKQRDGFVPPPEILQKRSKASAAKSKPGEPDGRDTFMGWDPVTRGRKMQAIGSMWWNDNWNGGRGGWGGSSWGGWNWGEGNEGRGWWWAQVVISLVTITFVTFMLLSFIHLGMLQRQQQNPRSVKKTKKKRKRKLVGTSSASSTTTSSSTFASS